MGGSALYFQYRPDETTTGGNGNHVESSHNRSNQDKSIHLVPACVGGGLADLEKGHIYATYMCAFGSVNSEKLDGVVNEF